MSLYIDDSGTRHPDRNPADLLPAHGHDWFGLGGVIVRDDEEQPVRERHASLCSKWELKGPLRSAEIRGFSDNFTWLGQRSPDERNAFFQDLTDLVIASAHGHRLCR